MRGSCLCGAVTFVADEPLRSVIACHCTQCRKSSGHFWAATSVPLDRFHLIETGGLRWFRSSSEAERGFCGDCGSSLFWKPGAEGRIAISGGSLDGLSGLVTAQVIFSKDAGDYYTTPQATEVLTGSCLCGANHFTLPGPMGKVTACHCSQCRKTSGHFSASFDAAETDLEWSRKSIQVRRAAGGSLRGFCPTCGSSLYFRAPDGIFSVEAGAIDNPTGGHLASHIFTSEKGDYYTLTDGLPQFLGWD